PPATGSRDAVRPDHAAPDELHARTPGSRRGIAVAGAHEPAAVVDRPARDHRFAELVAPPTPPGGPDEDLGAAQREDAGALDEAEVVADERADDPKVELEDRKVVARCDAQGALAPGRVHLRVGADDRALTVQDDDQ